MGRERAKISTIRPKIAQSLGLFCLALFCLPAQAQQELRPELEELIAIQVRSFESLEKESSRALNRGHTSTVSAATLSATFGLGLAKRSKEITIASAIGGILLLETTDIIIDRSGSSHGYQEYASLSRHKEDRIVGLPREVNEKLHEPTSNHYIHYPSANSNGWAHNTSKQLAELFPDYSSDAASKAAFEKDIVKPLSEAIAREVMLRHTRGGSHLKASILSSFDEICANVLGTYPGSMSTLECQKRLQLAVYKQSREQEVQQEFLAEGSLPPEGRHEGRAPSSADLPPETK